MGDSEDCDENLFSLRSSNTTIKTFDGLTYDASTLFKSYDMQTIKSQWEKENNQSGIIEGKRQKIERYVTIDGGEGVGDVKVLKENMYDLEGGEPSIFEKELRGRIKLEDMQEQKKQVHLAGRDYENTDYCQACGEGGDLTCCDHCPMAYHLKCLGYKNEAEFEREVSATTHFWRCPHHYCSKCSRNTSEAGGVLLRCYGCAHAYCEDCLNWKEENLYICDNQPPLMLKNLGFHICNQGYYIYCSKNCKENGKTQEKLYFEENLLPHEIMEFREMALMIWQLRTSKSNLTSKQILEFYDLDKSYANRDLVIKKLQESLTQLRLTGDIKHGKTEERIMTAPSLICLDGALKVTNTQSNSNSIDGTKKETNTQSNSKSISELLNGYTTNPKSNSKSMQKEKGNILEAAKTEYYCTHCHCVCSSPLDFFQHNKSKEHKRIYEAYAKNKKLMNLVLLQLKENYTCQLVESEQEGDLALESKSQA